MYDVLIIGAGPGGIFTAYELMEKNPKLKVAVFEMGHELKKRKCPIDGDKIKSCIHCKSCSIMSGFGGAGAFSDGKYNITNDFGGTLYQYIGKKEAIDLMEYVDKHKGILVAVNAEKILHSTPETESIINGNIGYCDGVGAVKAMHQKGFKGVKKIAGCELWLKIIAKYYTTKSFYLVGGKQDVIDETVTKLQKEFKGINIVGYRNGYI